jgi:hypothetical protein
MKPLALLLLPLFLFLSGCSHTNDKQEANQVEPLFSPPTETMENAANAPTKAPVSFSGTWATTSGPISFDIELEEREDGTVAGYHCGVTQDALRIDCCLSSDGLEPSVNGIVTNEAPIGQKRHSARLDITSCYLDAEVVAFVELQKDGALAWTLIDDSIIEHYIPKEATLRPKYE